jgi:hypothetical protein
MDFHYTKYHYPVLTTSDCNILPVHLKYFSYSNLFRISWFDSYLKVLGVMIFSSLQIRNSYDKLTDAELLRLNIHYITQINCLITAYAIKITTFYYIFHLSFLPIPLFGRLKIESNGDDCGDFGEV